MQCLSWRTRAAAHHRPASSTPTTVFAILSHPSNSALPLPCPLFTTSKQCFTHYPWAGAALLWTTLTFRHYLEPLGHQGQHLTYIFTASGNTGFFSILSFFAMLLLCFAAHCTRAVNCSLAVASGAITCVEQEKVEAESQNIQSNIFSHHSYSI